MYFPAFLCAKQWGTIIAIMVDTGCEADSANLI